jgi:hypothetical protein
MPLRGAAVTAQLDRRLITRPQCDYRCAIVVLSYGKSNAIGYSPNEVNAHLTTRRWRTSAVKRGSVPDAALNSGYSGTR